MCFCYLPRLPLWGERPRGGLPAGGRPGLTGDLDDGLTGSKIVGIPPKNNNQSGFKLYPKLLYKLAKISNLARSCSD